MAHQLGSPRRRPVALATTVLGFVMLAIYLTLIVNENGSIVEALPWALVMAIAPAAAAASILMGDPRSARRVMIFAVILFAVLGFLAILSIGIGFLVTAAVGIGAVRESSRAIPD